MLIPANPQKPTHTGSLCLAFILSILTLPTFSETLGNSPQCDNATLHTTTGPATLNARWTANTIILNWDAGNDATFTAPTQNDAAYSCEYDGGITLPTQPTRDGYTFGGWRVHSCLRDYYPENNGYSYRASINGQGSATSRATEYGLTQNNTWAVILSGGGMLKGRAVCSSTGASAKGDVGNPDESDGQNNCWCRATDFGDTCHVQVSNWVFYGRYSSKNDCMNACVGRCLNDVAYNSTFRQAIFGVTE